jgi:hypothetical protein
MKTKLIALALLAGSSLFAGTRFYAGAGFGYPAAAPVAVYAAPPAPLAAYATPAPGPGYNWVAGYRYPMGPRYQWRAGYWVRPPYPRANWVAPRYYSGRYYRGFWRR